MKSFFRCLRWGLLVFPMLHLGCGNAPPSSKIENSKTPDYTNTFPIATQSLNAEPKTDGFLSEPEFIPTLQATKADLIVVQVFSEKCGPCMEEALKLSALASEWRKRSIAVIGLGSDPQPKSVKRFYEDTGKRVTFPLYHAPWFAEKHQVFITPTFLIFEPDGKAVYESNYDRNEEVPIEKVITRFLR